MSVDTFDVAILGAGQFGRSSGALVNVYRQHQPQKSPAVIKRV